MQLAAYIMGLIANLATMPGANLTAALNALDVPINNRRYVAPNGSDSDGNGSILRPWASVTHAMAQITTAAPTARFCIFVTGRITEAGAVVLKPNVFVVGTDPQNTRCSATSWTIDSAWSAAGDNRTGFLNITVNGAVTIDFAAVSSNEGKVYFNNAWINSAVTFTRFSAINQIFVTQCLTFAAWTFHGCTVLSQTTLYQANVSFDTTAGDFGLQSINDAFLATLSVTRTTGAPTATLQNSYVAALSASGTITVSATLDGVPAAPSLSGGALVNQTTVLRTAGTASARILSGTGTPEGAVARNIGDLFCRTDGGLLSTLYVKESGSGTTGWFAK